VRDCVHQLVAKRISQEIKMVQKIYNDIIGICEARRNERKMKRNIANATPVSTRYRLLDSWSVMKTS
jgi:hypothetical protein